MLQLFAPEVMVHARVAEFNIPDMAVDGAHTVPSQAVPETHMALTVFWASKIALLYR
jgi:hypothetical protein